MDIIGILDKNKSSDLSNRMAVSLEKKKIQRRTSEFIDQVIEYICSELKFIKNGLTWSDSEPSKINDSNDEDLLICCLKNSFLQLPEQLSSELKDIFCSFENKEKDEEDSKDENNELETKTIEVSSNIPVSAAPKSYFGY